MSKPNNQPDLAVETAAVPNADGTLNITHYGTSYSHFWVGEIKRGRCYIYGQQGGSAILVVSKQGAKILESTREQAQKMVS